MVNSTDRRGWQPIWRAARLRERRGARRKGRDNDHTYRVCEQQRLPGGNVTGVSILNQEYDAARALGSLDGSGRAA
jgi:hypothetical protein